MANGVLVKLSNNSSVDQEAELFSTTSQGSISATAFVWNFKADMDTSGNSIFNSATSLFWDQTVTANNGSFGIRLLTTGGGSFILSEVNDPGLANLTKTGFVNFLNTTTTFSKVGTWSMDGPFAETGSKASQYNFILRVIPTEEFLSTNDISSSPQYNYGVESVSYSGVNWENLKVFPNSSQVAGSLINNLNVSVLTFGSFSYQQLLYSVVQRTYDIKKFEVFSTNKGQILEPFIFSRTLASGKVFDKVLAPTIDPYQTQNYVITKDKTGYIMDGFTELKYKILANSEVRIIMEYKYVDIATPLLLKKPELITQHGRSEYSNFSTSVNPTFEGNMKSGYEKFGCKFLHGRKSALEQKLIEVSSKEYKHLKWKESLRNRIDYIDNMLVGKDCKPDEEGILNRIESVGPEYIRTDLFIPTKAFVEMSMGDDEGNIDDTNPDDENEKIVEFPFDK